MEKTARYFAAAAAKPDILSLQVMLVVGSILLLVICAFAVRIFFRRGKSVDDA